MAFGRDFALAIAPSDVNGVQAPAAIDVSNLRCTFTVKKDLTPIPNHAVITVFNLGEQNRRFLENETSESKALVVRLDAGYKDEGTSQIYLGEIRNADSFMRGPDWETKMSTDDKGRKLQTTRINIPLGPGATAAEALRALARSLKIGEGNMEKAVSDFSSLGVTALFPRGGVLSGYVIDELTDVCRSAGLEWSIHDGALYFTRDGVADKTKAIVLSSNTGLIGSPTVDNEGRMTAQTIMIPGMRPGCVVNFDAKALKGGYKITKCEWHGDTHGDSWHSWHIRIHGVKH